MGNIIFLDEAWEEYLSWQDQDKKIFKKLNQLIRDTVRNGYGGLGKPEALKHELSGYWSKRITDEHRLIFKLDGDNIIIYACKRHYQA